MATIETIATKTKPIH